MHIPWSSTLTFNDELLHSVARKLLVTLFPDPQAYFFVTAFFIVGCTLYIDRTYSPDVFLAVILYYCIGGYFSANNYTRQHIAIAITMLSWRYAVKKKPWWFLLTVLIAIGFHSSAIVTLPLYFLSGRRFNKNVLFGYSVFALLIIVFNRQVTAIIQMVMYSGYGGGYGTESSNPLRLVLVVLTVAGIWLLTRKSSHNRLQCRGFSEEQNIRLKNLLCHGAVLYSIFQLLSAVNMLMFSRVAAYFSVSSALVMQYGIESLGYKYNKVLLKFGLLLLAIAWFVIMNANGKLTPTPYTPFWQFPIRLR